MRLVIKRIMSIICALALFLFVGNALKYILYDDSQSYTRLLFHQLYESDENIDIIFVGSSHVYRTFNPLVTDAIFNEYTFNMGSSSQFLDGSFAMIKEACRYHDVNQVYLELYYGITEGTDYDERTQMSATYEVSDPMRPSFNKLQFLLNASSPDYYSNGFILARRNWEKIFDLQYIMNTISKKQSPEYKNYEWMDPGNGDYYVDRGFFANDTIVADNVYLNKQAYGSVDSAINNVNPDSDWYKSLISIIEYCHNKGIKLVLFVTPEPEWTIVGKGNYQEYYKSISNIAKEYNTPFYDFNLCKPTYFNANDRNLFKDEDHLNTNGANLFSDIFGRFFTGQIDEEALFYSSYTEKLNDEIPNVYGVAGLCTEADGNRYGYIISNRNSGIEYQIIATPTDTGEPRMIQPFNENIVFSVPSDETGVIDITWRMIGNKDKLYNLEISY